MRVMITFTNLLRTPLEQQEMIIQIDPNGMSNSTATMVGAVKIRKDSAPITFTVAPQQPRPVTLTVEQQIMDQVKLIGPLDILI